MESSDKMYRGIHGSKGGRGLKNKRQGFSGGFSKTGPELIHIKGQHGIVTRVAPRRSSVGLCSLDCKLPQVSGP